MLMRERFCSVERKAAAQFRLDVPETVSGELSPAGTYDQRSFRQYHRRMPMGQARHAERA